jgi:broad specificity phosphatase PhoE
MTDHRCVVIRHGETEWSRSGRHTGRTDLALLPEGEEQAMALHPRLSVYRFAAVWTSPLVRARETCRLAGLDEGAVVDPDLAEWDYGSYEGLTTVEIRRRRPGWSLFDDGAPGGERAEEVGRRVDRVIERVRSVSGDVACVAHGHVLRVMAARWAGLEASAGRSFLLGPASLGELGWDREQPVICWWNLVESRRQ